MLLMVCVRLTDRSQAITIVGTVVIGRQTLAGQGTKNQHFGIRPQRIVGLIIDFSHDRIIKAQRPKADDDSLEQG